MGNCWKTCVIEIVLDTCKLFIKGTLSPMNGILNEVKRGTHVVGPPQDFRSITTHAAFYKFEKHKKKESVTLHLS